MSLLSRVLAPIALFTILVGSSDASGMSATDVACLSVFVSDAVGEAIPGASVLLAPQGDGSSCRCQMLTNLQGVSAFAISEPGPYRVSASLDGFENEAFERVLLMRGHPAAINCVLRQRWGGGDEFGPGVPEGAPPPMPQPTLTPTPIPPCCRPACQ